MKKYIFTLVAASVLVACKTNELYLNVVEPAPVTIPSYIQNVGVIDRSASTDKTRPLDVADKILTLEGAGLDRIGAEESIKGLTEELLKNSRFKAVKKLDKDFRSPTISMFPVPLSWEIIADVCRESGTDALFSLERFDTDTKIGYSNRKVNIKTPLGSIPALEHQADMSTLVKTGWRIYDPAAKAILDEFIYDESIVFHGRGINPLAAAEALTGRKDAVMEVSNRAGHGYAMRLIPYERRVMRDYFVKGTDNFKIAQRKAITGNWNEAGELWRREMNNPKMKIAGRATYNMAIISEINGDLGSALDYARKSYEDYNTKQGIRYVRILENRMYKNELLGQQGN
jgi:hypothetical protein